MLIMLREGLLNLLNERRVVLRSCIREKTRCETVSSVESGSRAGTHVPTFVARVATLADGLFIDI